MPKEVLAKETYVKPPEIVERIVTAPRNNVAFTNPSPDKKYFLKTESEGLPSIDAFGKPHYRLGGVEIDYKANRARASDDARQRRPHAHRSDERRDAHDRDAEGRARQRRRPGRPTARASATSRTSTLRRTSSSPTSRPESRCRSRRRRSSRCACRAFDWTADGKSIVTVLLPDNRPAEPKRPPVETGPLVRTSEAGKVLQNRNYASLLRDPYDKELLDYYTMGQLALIDVKTKAVKKIGAPALITNVDASPDGQYFRVTLQIKPYSYLVPVANFGTVEQLWDANGKSLAEVSKTVMREGTGGANDTTAFAGGAGFGGRGAAQIGHRQAQSPVESRSALGSCICRPKLLRPARLVHSAAAAVTGSRGPRWRGRWRRGRAGAQGSPLSVDAAVRGERCEGPVRGEQPHDDGRVQRRRQDAVRERGQRSLRGSSGRSDQAL